ncbi:MAG: metalloregulator ArsR/SmtB family transcription factor [Alphaproteobacteria bacterium]|nr:metalloregulator ArsR/SmtB family transcription factor [Alphaproteobacteria bacterium]
MPPDRLGAIFAALADPTRRAILTRLARGPASVKDLAAPFDITLQAVSRHLKVLEGAGLIARARLAQWRPCALVPDPLGEAALWLDDCRQAWEERREGRGDGT